MAGGDELTELSDDLKELGGMTNAIRTLEQDSVMHQR